MRSPDQPNTEYFAKLPAVSHGGEARLAKRINTNHGYLAFDREVEFSRSWLQSKITDTCTYSAGILIARLTQRLVEVALSPYVSWISSAAKVSGDIFPRSGTVIDCGRCSVEIGTGKLAIKIKHLLANHAEFFAHWAYCLWAVLALKNTEKKNRPAVLVFGVGEESLFSGSNDERFIRYCRLGPIAPLRDGNRFIIQSTSNNTSSRPLEFVYFRNPLIRLLQETRLSVRDRFQLLANHLHLFFGYLAGVFRFPALSLIGKDFAYASIARSLNERNLIEAVIVTTSDYKNQPLWMRELSQQKTHMVSYSQNWKPIFYLADCVSSDVPDLRWGVVGTHWVWTHAFGDYLRHLGHKGEIKVVGPIVWYLPEVEVPRKNGIEITIFDVPALTDEVMLSVGELTNYYHPDNLASFINDLACLKPGIEEIFQLPVRFRLKTKREYIASSYDRGYYELIEKLGALGVLSLEHFSTNMYSLISSSHLVIAYPFTSPVALADVLNVPSIYYDPTGDIVKHTFCDAQSLNCFANTPQSLFDAVVAELCNSFKPNKPMGNGCSSKDDRIQ